MSHEYVQHISSGAVVWFTGLSGAGKTTLAESVRQELVRRGTRVEILDGDIVRTHLSKGLGFSKEDRDTNIRRIGFVCHLLCRNGVVALASAISPYRSVRDEVRAMVGENFIEVFVDCPLEECIRRDVKGLYKKALEGQIPYFTGISDPYEPPADPELRVRSNLEDLSFSTQRVLAYLEQREIIPATTRTGLVSSGDGLTAAAATP
jgi:adenylylsulfate kinase